MKTPATLTSTLLVFILVIALAGHGVSSSPLPQPSNRQERFFLPFNFNLPKFTTTTAAPAVVAPGITITFGKK
ncbi:hypothetical protein Hamer_G025756 [Homarus americanus]|uniref:Uncharacterized protein n=1 Tax=Homarus americanus TaxID=6706 RepID=A0A8J5JH18_HOMAM|nr:hypothetical protein Hamer_G006530 [Homarus americanus]KAG7161533.1 hypothetical protein Hamer_G025756 [Homarus americanus]